MTPRWEDVNARARGLSTHLLSRDDLDALARQADLPALSDALGRLGVVPAADESAPGPGAIELGIRRWAAASLQTLGRWVGARNAVLPLVFDEEDRRSVRAILRGAAARVPAAMRIAGLLPTPTLPERALEELAAAPTVAAVGALLSTWRHPFAAVLAPVTADGTPDLLAVERALGRVAGQAATRAARRSGSRPLRSVVAEGIDLENAALAIILAAAGEKVTASEHFLPGGTLVDADLFAEAVEGHDPLRAATRLAGVFAGTPYAAAIAEGARDPGGMEGELLRQRILLLTRRVRMAPLEPLTTLLFALRLRAQLTDLQRIVWAVALGAPRAPLTERWLSVAA